MDFALNLILSLEDNATEGLTGAVGSLEKLCTMAEKSVGAVGKLKEMASLQVLAHTANTVGNAFLGMGTNIANTMSGVVKSVTSVGGEVVSATRALGHLYADAGATDMEKWAIGTEKVGEAMEYAANSIFNFKDLLPSIQMLKANSIEAFDEISSSSGNTSQTLMDYAADLAAFNPQMHNAYGQGINAAMGAINEYIAEGNKKSLKSGASLDITGLLGEKVGGSIEERSRQIADLMEKVNIAGYVKNMSGTVQQQIGNMEDKLYIFLAKLADSGIYDTYTSILGKFAEFVNGIPTEELTEIANVIGEAFTEIMEPIGKVADRLIGLAKRVKDFVKQNPKLAKLAIKITAISGGLLILGGVAFKLVGSFALLSNSIVVMQGTFGSFVSMVGSGVGTLITTLGPIAALIGLLALAWTSDFGGIRTLTIGFLDDIMFAWNMSSELMKKDAYEMGESVRLLGETGGFVNNLIVGLTKVRTLLGAISEVNASSDGYTLSLETWQQLDALGLLPVMNRFLDLKARVEAFLTGFQEGMDRIGEKVRKFGEDLRSSMEGTVFEELITNFERLLKALSNPSIEDFQNFGNTVADVLGSIGGTVASIAGQIMNWVGLLLQGYVLPVATTVFDTLKNMWDTWGADLVGNIAGFVTRIIEIAMPLITWIMTYIVPIIGDFVSLQIKIIGGLINFIGMRLNHLMETVNLLIDFFKGVFTGDMDLVVESAKGLLQNAIDHAVDLFNGFLNFFQGVWDSLVDLGASIGDAVVSALTGVVTAGMNAMATVIVGFVNTVITGINTFLGVINAIPGVNIEKLAPIAFPDLTQMATGGVAETPITALIGEDGAEAVMPLEKNTGWMSVLADNIVSRITPSPVSSASPNSPLVRNNTYSTTNTSGGSSSTDNSVTVEQGAIVLNVQNASQQEAERLADIIIRRIKDMQETDDMLHYRDMPDPDSSLAFV